MPNTPGCEPQGPSVPQYCATQFKELAEGQATALARLDAILKQTAKTNGHVAELFEKHANLFARVSSLEATAKALGSVSGKLLHYGWRAALLAAGLVYAGKEAIPGIIDALK